MTGCFELNCSNDDCDVNAPPDVLAWESRKSLGDVLADRKTGRLFICGLALDFCVLDTAINATLAGFQNVYIIVDATRAAFVDGAFITPVNHLREAFTKYSIRLAPARDCLPPQDRS